MNKVASGETVSSREMSGQVIINVAYKINNKLINFTDHSKLELAASTLEDTA